MDRNQAGHVVSCSILARRFARAQDGAVLVFGLIVFVLMLMVSGIAVDVMRYESERVRLQGTSDRAVLAATSLLNRNTSLTPEELAQAYFDAEGFGDFARGNIVVTENQETGRTVSITPSARMETMFMRLANVNQLDMATPAAANQAPPRKVEIVMVLDRSGSMNRRTNTGRSRMEETKIAAKAFVQLILDEVPQDDVSISLVTYDLWVVPPPGFLNMMPNVTGNGACMDFTDWANIEAGIGPQGSAEGTAGVVQNSIMSQGSRRNCSTSLSREMRLMMNTFADFEAAIDPISANSATSIDLAARFGAMLLDPSIRDYVTERIDSGALPEAMRGRPFDWDDDGVLRVMLLMTDGESNPVARGYSRDKGDDHTLAICEGLRANNVLVYSVSFEAPQRGRDLLSDCASAPNFYFNSDGVGLVRAFERIAQDIAGAKLRLTQ
jgi:Flp pilus assembly protein TadG